MWFDIYYITSREPCTCGCIKVCVLNMTLFIHLFETQNNTTNHVRDLCLISFRKVSKFFNNYSNTVRNFKDRFFLVPPFDEEAHVKISKIEPRYISFLLGTSNTLPTMGASTPRDYTKPNILSMPSITQVEVLGLLTRHMLGDRLYSS